MLPTNMKDPYCSSNRKCNHAQNSKNFIRRADSVGHKNCRRHNAEMYMQSNRVFTQRNHPHMHFHHTYDAEAALPDKIFHTSSPERSLEMFTSSPTEKHFHTCRPKQQFPLQQHPVERGQGSNPLEPNLSSHYYKKGKEVSSYSYKPPTSSLFSIQSSDHPHQPHFYHQSKHKEKVPDAPYPHAPSLTLDLIQHATGNRAQTTVQRLRSSNIEPLSGREFALESANASTPKTVVDDTYRKKQNVRIETKCNRNSSGSNIIPPPNDFGCYEEVEKVLCVDPRLEDEDKYKQNETITKCKNQDASNNLIDVCTETDNKPLSR